MAKKTNIDASNLSNADLRKAISNAYKTAKPLKKKQLPTQHTLTPDDTQFRLAVKFKHGPTCLYTSSTMDDFVAFCHAASAGQFIRDRFCPIKPPGHNNNYSIVSIDTSMAQLYQDDNVREILRSGTGWGAEDELARNRMSTEYENGVRGNVDAIQRLKRDSHGRLKLNEPTVMGKIYQPRANAQNRDAQGHYQEGHHYNAPEADVLQDVASTANYFDPFATATPSVEQSRNHKGQFASGRKNVAIYRYPIQSSWCEEGYLVIV